MSSRIRAKSESEEEDGEIGEVEREVDRPTKKGGGDLWTQVLESEVLEEKLRDISKPSNSTDVKKKFERGAESYTIGKDVEFEATDDFQPVVSNDFETVDDLPEFGVPSRSTQRKQANLPTARPQNRKRRIERSVESLNSLDSYGKRYGKKKRPSRQYFQVSMHPNFSYEELFDTQIPDDKNMVQTSELIGRALGEEDLIPITFACTVIGKTQSLKLFAQTVETEKTGGLQVRAGNRRRTPGGVFFELLRCSESISQNLKNQIREFTQKHAKEKQQNDKLKNLEIDDGERELPTVRDCLVDEIRNEEK
ncbi:hypothetical protein M3Y94_00933000 [Aphelenchoides besseyi]|nr:hypothetical protein M3Y94_00933000 [Aphelenchoides besseyi]KAI6224972.1 Phosphorylated adapter RNA export protein [Aphelenchoides besseyi]